MGGSDSGGFSDSDLNSMQRRVSCIVHLSGRRCKGCAAFLRQDNAGKECTPCIEKRVAALVQKDTRTLSPDVIAKYWALCVNGSKRGCWGWRGSKTAAGLPVIRVGYGLFYARRVSFQIHHGEIARPQYVAVECGQKVCTNPVHLALGDRTLGKHLSRELQTLARLLRRLGYRLVKHGKN